MVVYTTATDGFADVADEIAAAREEDLVRDAATARETDEVVVWVDHPETMAADEEDVVAFQERLMTRGPSDGGFTLITGYRPEDARALYFEETAASDDDVALFTDRFEPDRLPDTPDETTLVGEELTASRVGELTEEPVRSFSMSGSGRLIHIYLSEGVICGVPESLDVSDYDEPQPYCITEDYEVDCPLYGELLPADQINAAHFFLLSCTHTLPNGASGLPVYPSLGMLQGADSMIGSYRVSSSHPYETLLHRSVFESGYDLLERTYLMLRNNHENGIMAYPYVPFGRPEAGVTGEPPGGDVETERVSDETGERLRVTVTDVSGYLIDEQIPREKLPATDDRYYVRLDRETDDPVYYLAVPEEDTVRVLVFTGSRLDTEELTFDVSPRPSRYAERTILDRAARNVETLDEVGLLPDEAREQADALRNDYRGFALEGDREGFEATAHQSIDDRLGGVLGQMNAVEETVLDDLHEEGASPFRAYTRESVDDDVYTTDELCPICEERVVFVKQYRSWTGDSVRLRGACSKDGLVFEVPAEGRNTDPTQPYVETDLTWGDERWQPLRMSFQNPTEEPMRATFEPIALHEDGESIFDPVRQTERLAPGETTVAEFRVDTDRLEYNEYFIMGTVAANLDIYVGYHLARLGNRSGYVPPHIR